MPAEGTEGWGGVADSGRVSKNGFERGMEWEGEPFPDGEVGGGVEDSGVDSIS